MYIPPNWDDINPVSSLKPKPGYYILAIIDVQEDETSNNDECLKFQFDIDEGEFTGFYTKLSASFNKTILLKHTQLVKKESALAYWKKFILDVQNSNDGFKFNFQPRLLIGKKIGAYLIEEYYEDKNGKERVYLKPDKFFSVAEVKEINAKQANKKETNTTSKEKDDDLPF